MILNIIISLVILGSLLYIWFSPGINLKFKFKTKKDKNKDLASSYLSKSALRNSSKEDVIYHNVNLLDKSGNILWQGNINITTRFENLYDLKKVIGTLYICSKDESDYKNKSYQKI